MTKHQLVALIDFGGRSNQLIARRVRDESVYCEILPCVSAAERVRALSPIGIILIGDPDGTAAFDSGILSLGCPVLATGTTASVAGDRAEIMLPDEENTDSGKARLHLLRLAA